MKKESLLWEITKDSSKNASYLFGTMHVKNDDAYSFIEQAKSKIDSTHLYIGEMDLNDIELNEVHQHFMLEEPMTLVDLLGLKKYEKIRSIILKAFQIDLDHIAHYKPLIISNMIAESVLTKEYDISLDHQLWTYALESNKTMLGLESAKDQYTIMENIEMKYQIKSLLDAARNVSKFRKKVMQLSKYYADQRLTDLYQVSKKSMGGIRHLMIYDRNKVMSDRLISYMSEATAFCAVGAAHLPGKYGIISFLKRSGYKVKPI